MILRTSGIEVSIVFLREAQWGSRGREFDSRHSEQAHIATKEKQEVPSGELPALLIVCGFLQGASAGAHPVFVFKKKLPCNLE